MNDSAPPSNETEIRFSVLLVDDEPLILSSLRRLLRNQPYDLLLAESGEQALQLLESRPVDLVVSDARMPNMDGAALLAEIHRRSPETIRILLTGHADLPTIAKAINEGRIHHYLSKPWNDDELLLTLRQSLEYLHSERERRRLERLTQEQNDRLQQLNATLEKRVQARTAELQQTADMLDLAYEELKRSYVVGTEVFSLLVNQRLPKDKQTNQQIIELVRACCASGLVDESDGRDLAMAAALYNIGKLSWNDTLLRLALGPALSPRPRSFPRLPGTQRVAADVAGTDAGRRPPDSPSPGALGRQRLSGPPQGRGHSPGLAPLEAGGGFRRAAARTDPRTAHESRRSTDVHPQIRRPAVRPRARSNRSSRSARRPLPMSPWPIRKSVPMAPATWFRAWCWRATSPPTTACCCSTRARS